MNEEQPKSAVRADDWTPERERALAMMKALYDERIENEMRSIFETLFAVDVSAYTDERKGLTYLSWSHALSEVMKRYPDMSYCVKRFGLQQLPFQYDPMLGYMVYTSVTIRGITKEMWLPVLDTNNKAMKSEPYTYDTKNQKGIKVEAATFYDINRAIMRCLVKNLAVFGLALYIYNKDDLPEGNDDETADETPSDAVSGLIKQITETGSKLIAAGATRDEVYEIVKARAGDPNPANIRDEAVANAVLNAMHVWMDAHTSAGRDDPAVPATAKKTKTKKESKA